MPAPVGSRSPASHSCQGRRGTVSAMDSKTAKRRSASPPSATKPSKARASPRRAAPRTPRRRPPARPIWRPRPRRSRPPSRRAGPRARRPATASTAAASGEAPTTPGRRHVDVGGVEEAPVGRVVGAGAAAVGGELRVHRVQPDEVAAVARRLLGEDPERGEVADAAVALAPQRVEVGRDAEAAAPLPVVARDEAAARRHREQGGVRLVAVEHDPVAAGGLRRQGEARAQAAAPVRRVEGAALAAVDVEVVAVRRAVLAQHRDVVAAGQRSPAVDHDLQRHRRAGVAHGRGRQRAQAPVGQAGEAVARLPVRAGLEPHGAQDGALGVGRHAVALARGREPLGRDAGGLGQGRHDLVGRAAPARPDAAPSRSAKSTTERGSTAASPCSSGCGGRRRCAVSRARRPAPARARLGQRDRQRLGAGVEHGRHAVGRAARQRRGRRQHADQRRGGRVLPVGGLGRAPVRQPPGDVGQDDPAGQRRARREAVARQRRMGGAQVEQAARRSRACGPPASTSRARRSALSCA